MVAELLFFSADFLGLGAGVVGDDCEGEGGGSGSRFFSADFLVTACCGDGIVADSSDARFFSADFCGLGAGVVDGGC